MLANWTIPGKLIPGMGGAMDLATGAKRVIVAMQHAAKGQSKVVTACDLPLTSSRPIDLLVTDLAVFAVRSGRLVLTEHAPDADIATIRANTLAAFDVSDAVKPIAYEC